MPEGALRSTRPLVMPYRVVLGYAETVARSVGDGATIVVFTHGGRQRQQQLETWHIQRWASKLNLQFVDPGQDPLDAAKRLAKSKPRPNLVMFWGYGIGLAPGDPPGLIPKMEAALGQAILLAHVACTLFVRNLLYPSVDGCKYVEEGNL